MSDETPAIDGRELDAAILAAIESAGDDASPTAVALEVGASLGTVNDRVAALVEAGLVERAGFNTCRLTEAGRARQSR